MQIMNDTTVAVNNATIDTMYAAFYDRALTVAELLAVYNSVNIDSILG